MAITWTCKHHSELDTREVYGFLALRFLPVTEVYLDDGIPHIGMRRA